MSELKTDIELIKKDIQYIKQFIENDRKRFEKHIEESELYRIKVDTFGAIDSKMNDHIVQDRWMFGIIITLLIFILGKVLIG